MSWNSKEECPWNSFRMLTVYWYCYPSAVGLESGLCSGPGKHIFLLAPLGAFYSVGTKASSFRWKGLEREVNQTPSITEIKNGWNYHKNDAESQAEHN